MAFLPYGRQTIEADDLAAVEQALQADFLTTGPRVEAFEAAFAEKIGARHAVACANGTAALHLSMLALGAGPGDVVIVPSITFLATANCARLVGAQVVFADVDPFSGLMTGATLEAALARAEGRRVAAVIPVHLRGEVADMPAIRDLASRAGAAVVEDACHALGSESDFGRVGEGRLSELACFSFHPVKTIATGEGGMVTTNDQDLAEHVRRLRSHGMMRPPGADPWIYEMDEIGLNYRLPDLLCALGISQLAKLDRFVARRRQLVRLYAERLAAMAPTVRLAASPAWSRAAPHLLVALIDFAAAGVSRRQIWDRLRARGVGAQVHYIPVHSQPYYRRLDPGLRLPGADAWYERALSLPLFPAMADGDVDHVVAALADALTA